MSLDTYSNLQLEIANFVHRDDLAAVIPTFVTLTEGVFNRELRTIPMERRATQSVSSEYVTLPDDFLELRNVQLNWSNTRLLEYTSPQAMDQLGDSTGIPVYYTIVSNQLQLSPTPAGEYEVEIAYFAKIDALSATNATNWILDTDPSLYLAGGLFYAFAHILDEQRSLFWKGQFEDGLARLKSNDRKARWSGNVAAPMIG